MANARPLYSIEGEDSKVDLRRWGWMLSIRAHRFMKKASAVMCPVVWLAKYKHFINNYNVFWENFIINLPFKTIRLVAGITKRPV